MDILSRKIAKMYPWIMPRIYACIRTIILPAEKIERFVPEGKVLDVGCGYGIIPIYFALKNKKRDVTGSEINKKRHLISRVKTIKKRGIETLIRIEEIEVSNISEKTYIDQIIPIFFLNYEFLLLISQILKSSHSNKISEILNEVCKRNLQEVIALEITSKGSFYDIDKVFDLDYLNKKKGGQ